MDSRISVSVILTIAAFALTLYLFATIMIMEVNEVSVDPAMKSGVVSPPAEPEIQHAGAKIFKANCMPCHRIDRKLVGPALAGVMDRRDSLWVVKMIRNSSKLIASGDPDAVAIFEEYNRIQMTSFSTLSDEELRSLLEYLKLEGEQAKPMPAPSRVEV